MSADSLRLFAEMIDEAEALREQGMDIDTKDAREFHDWAVKLREPGIQLTNQDRAELQLLLISCGMAIIAKHTSIEAEVQAVLESNDS